MHLIPLLFTSQLTSFSVPQTRAHKSFFASSQLITKISALQDPHLNPFSHSSLSMAAQTHPHSSPSLKKYPGNCHCGAFKFQVLLPEIDSVTECNCSICFKKSYKWIYPLPENFTVEKGSLATLSSYTFGKDELMHLVSNPA
jgi:hypothetical protein